MYLLIARQIIGKQEPDQTRVPEAQRPALLQELEQRRSEVRRIIAYLDREAKNLEAQGAQDRNLELYHRLCQVYADRDTLRAELQFYIDLAEALNYTPTKTTPEERAKANLRARTWADDVNGRRHN